MEHVIQKPTGAFIAASWVALGIGLITFIVGLYNANVALSEKGFYFAVLVLGAYSTVSLSKAVRDKAEDIPVSGVYYGLSWVAFGVSCLLLVVGLWNADTLLLSEKGFYALGFTLSMFGAMAVQKNVRDCAGDMSLPKFKSRDASDTNESDINDARPKNESA